MTGFLLFSSSSLSTEIQETMVSLPDSTQSPSSRSQRSHARSMRTVRSNLYRTDRNRSPDPRDLTGFSENLTDSVVDFRLRELAAAIGSSAIVAAKSGSIDATTDLLDISQDFSDFSSFNSDISGELQRLASVPSSSPPQAQACRNPSFGDGDDHLDDPDLQGLGFWGETIVSSSEILETASPESLEPAVTLFVDILESSSAEIDAKRTAAGKLRLFAKHQSDFREMIGSSGAIQALIPLLRSTDPAAQENAVTALLNLSLEEQNKAPITAAGAIKPLVYALKTGTAIAKQNAACALLSLSMIEDNRTTIGVCGAIPPLVSLLLNGSTRGKKDALTTLYKLCAARQNKERTVSAGAVRPLVALVGEHGSGTTEKAMVVLSCLAGIPEGREAIVEEGGIPALVEAIEDGSVKGKEFAVLTLLQLCADSAHNRGLLVREGAIPPLAALSQSGSARAKHKAETLLGYLREQRQQDAGAAAAASTGLSR
ncbi:hypothetical protein J5N97_008341 [Dioscorea zingiberensis]|uniref:U-box domain-containing protein n=1 Tax=Dioscorea zingiberensis TaxID=325984 RepID=A0A9D5HKX2_9LILI|nr:hypothetical protein J5N97_008341 [Dioscorea zingiberensis]